MLAYHNRITTPNQLTTPEEWAVSTAACEIIVIKPVWASNVRISSRTACRTYDASGKRVGL